MYVQTQKYKQQICASETKDSFSSFIKKNQKPTSQSHYSGALTVGTFYKQDNNRLK